MFIMWLTFTAQYLGRQGWSIRSISLTACFFYFIKVFPDEFSNRPSLHILLPLPDHACRFGTLRNTSVSVKEAVHKIYKNAVPHMNKHNIQWDLTAYENTMQAIHFVLEGYSPAARVSS